MGLLCEAEICRELLHTLELPDQGIGCWHTRQEIWSRINSGGQSESFSLSLINFSYKCNLYTPTLNYLKLWHFSTHFETWIWIELKRPSTSNYSVLCSKLYFTSTCMYIAQQGLWIFTKWIFKTVVAQRSSNNLLHGLQKQLHGGFLTTYDWLRVQACCHGVVTRKHVISSSNGVADCCLTSISVWNPKPLITPSCLS